MRLFYLEYSIQQTLSVKSDTQVVYEITSQKLEVPGFKLSWSHYEIEAAKNQWSLRELKRQFDSALYMRLALSKDKKGIKAGRTMMAPCVV